MRILLTSPDPWNSPIPYYIAPQRIARALTRAGHTLFNLDLYGDPYSTAGLPPDPPNITFQTRWGLSTHTKEEDYFKNLRETTVWFKPDLAYVFGWKNNRKEVAFFKERGIAVGLHRADPYWFVSKGNVVYPSKGTIQNFKEADFFTLNEGQAWNYLRQNGLEDKAHLLSHAIDPELAPPLGEEKRFLCSTVMGGEDPPRMSDLINYYYQVANRFPNQLFIGGGGIWKNMKWQLSRKGKQRVYDDKGQFNITKICDFNCETFPKKQNPSVLCHKFIHRLYSQSYYGFTPWGWYLREGPQSEYNMRTFGTKIFEMGGSGAAMLSCWVHNIEEVVTDGKTGFILRSPEDTEKAFQYAVDNPKEVRRMGEEAYRDVHKRHSWDVRYRDILVPIFKDLGLM